MKTIDSLCYNTNLSKSSRLSKRSGGRDSNPYVRRRTVASKTTAYTNSATPRRILLKQSIWYSFQHLCSQVISVRPFTITNKVFFTENCILSKPKLPSIFNKSRYNSSQFHIALKGKFPSQFYICHTFRPFSKCINKLSLSRLTQVFIESIINLPIKALVSKTPMCIICYLIGKKRGRFRLSVLSLFIPRARCYVWK
jgi:hypothetical protein